MTGKFIIMSNLAVLIVATPRRTYVKTPLLFFLM